MRFDPHVHSRWSYDSGAALHDLLAAAADAGLDAVAVTDHDAIEGSLRAASLAPEYGLLGVPGVEVSTADGHLLALGVERRPEVGRSLAATVAWVRDRGGLAVVPHPFQRTRHGATTIPDCDGVEVYNALLMTGVQNRRARRFADREGYPHLAGSDAHVPRMVGRAYTEVDLDPADPTETDPGELLDAVRQGRSDARGSRAPRRRYVRKFATNASIRTGSSLRSALGRR